MKRWCVDDCKFKHFTLCTTKQQQQTLNLITCLQTSQVCVLNQVVSHSSQGTITVVLIIQDHSWPFLVWNQLCATATQLYPMHHSAQVRFLTIRDMFEVPCGSEHQVPSYESFRRLPWWGKCSFLPKDSVQCTVYNFCKCYLWSKVNMSEQWFLDEHTNLFRWVCAKEFNKIAICLQSDTDPK